MNLHYGDGCIRFAAIIALSLDPVPSLVSGVAAMKVLLLLALQVASIQIYKRGDFDVESLAMYVQQMNIIIRRFRAPRCFSQEVLYPPHLIVLVHLILLRWRWMQAM